MDWNSTAKRNAIKSINAIKGANGAGWAIVITLVVRTILLPLMLVQQEERHPARKIGSLAATSKLIQEA